jgi:predicted kinase
MKTLFIFRGFPGSGKSSAVEELVKELYDNKRIPLRVCSADFFWHKDSANEFYDFKQEFLEYAHLWCQGEAYNAMFNNVPVVIIDNCNITVEDMLPYIKAAAAFGYAISIKEPETPWRYNPEECAAHTVHKVPLEIIQRMAKKWQPLKLFST